MVGRRLLDLGEQQGDSNLLVEGHLILGPALGFLGDSAAAIEHLDKAIALFDPERHGRGRFRLGPNPGVAARAVSGLLHWVFGYPERADRLARSALELATELSHPYSLAYATFHVGVLDLWNGRDKAAHARAVEVIAIAREHDYQVWEAVGLVLQGVTAVRLGRHAEGLELCERGISSTRTCAHPHLLAAAPGYPRGRVSNRGQPVNGARAAGPGDCTGRPRELGGRFSPGAEGLAPYDPRRRRGGSAGTHRGFRAWRSVGTITFQLKAATALVRLDEAPTEGEAIERLRTTLDRFTEGFDSPILRDARAALETAPSGLGTR